MADITKCKGGDSQLCDSCWRFLAPVNKYKQSFMEVPLYDGGKCEEYWSINDRSKDS